MQKEKLIVIPNKKDLSSYSSFNKFILPLENYSIGFDVYFNVNEINEISKHNEVYVIMNKFLHRNIKNFKEIYNLFYENIKFIVEDIGLTSVIDKKRIVLYENHIYSNYVAINYLNSIGYNSLVINNDLTINEIDEIIKKTNSELFYFYINKNDIMYSRRNLVHNYNEYYNYEDVDSYKLIENVSKKELLIKDEKDGSVVKNNKVFCASKYLDKLSKLNLIVNFTGLNEFEEIIIDNITNSNLYNLIAADYYFLENDIKYKVGDL